MPSAYEQLLSAIIQHLEALKARGVRHVATSADTLRSLSQPIGRMSATPPSLPAITPIRAAVEAQVSAAAQPTRAVSIVISTTNEPSLATPKPIDPTTKAAALAELQTRVLSCIKCPHLAASRKNVVFGVGNIDSPLMFVGEAPGADEDERGEPFVGKAGQLLTKIIQAMGLERSDVYIANILKCRPDTPGEATGNRKPTSDEMATCIPYLHEQIDIIQPKVLVALGATAVEGLLGKTVGITKLRGAWKTYRNIPLMPTYHPAYLLRNQAMSEKRRVWEDMLQVMEKLGLPITDKQRRFFTRT